MSASNGDTLGLRFGLSCGAIAALEVKHARQIREEKPPSVLELPTFGQSLSRSMSGPFDRGTNHYIPTTIGALRMNNHSPITIIVAALIIAGSMAVLFRWHVISSSIGLQRLDRWTGEIVACTPVMDLSDAEKLHVGVQYRCKEMTAEELRQVKVDPTIR